jgi:hypothetical protein
MRKRYSRQNLVGGGCRLLELTAEADLARASTVGARGAVGAASGAAEGQLLFVYGVFVLSHLEDATY